VTALHPGDCFRGTTFDRHLQIILVIAQAARLACVNATSFGSGLDGDRSCVLKRGDHATILHDSCIVYERARLVRIEDLEKGFERGLLEHLDPLRSSVFKRVIQGAIESEDTPGHIVNLLQSARDASA